MRISLFVKKNFVKTSDFFQNKSSLNLSLDSHLKSPKKRFLRDKKHSITTSSLLLFKKKPLEITYETMDSNSKKRPNKLEKKEASLMQNLKYRQEYNEIKNFIISLLRVIDNFNFEAKMTKVDNKEEVKNYLSSNNVSRINKFLNFYEDLKQKFQDIHDFIQSELKELSKQIKAFKRKWGEDFKINIDLENEVIELDRDFHTGIGMKLFKRLLRIVDHIENVQINSRHLCFANRI